MPKASLQTSPPSCQTDTDAAGNGARAIRSATTARARSAAAVCARARPGPASVRAAGTARRERLEIFTAYSAPSIAAFSSASSGVVRGPNTLISVPSLPTSSLWKFHTGSAGSPTADTAHL